MNKVLLVGKVSRDPEFKHVNDKAFVMFNVETVESWDGKNYSSWHRVVAWQRAAQAAESFGLMNGTPVEVEGRLSHRSFDGKNGKQYVTEVVADSIRLATVAGGGAGERFPEDDLP